MRTEAIDAVAVVTVAHIVIEHYHINPALREFFDVFSHVCAKIGVEHTVKLRHFFA